eukprot:135093-Alexandrium_andersonii.AAC.1
MSAKSSEQPRRMPSSTAPNVSFKRSTVVPTEGPMRALVAPSSSFTSCVAASAMAFLVGFGLATAALRRKNAESDAATSA